MKWTHVFLLSFQFYKKFVAWSKSYILPGFAPLPFYNVIAFFANEIQERTLFNRASSLAFNFMLAFFPATIFLFTLIPYIHIRISRLSCSTSFLQYFLITLTWYSSRLSWIL